MAQEKFELTEDQQWAAQGVLTYVLDLFTASPKETFTRDEVLVVLSCVRTDAELFNPDLLVEFDETVAAVEERL